MSIQGIDYAAIEARLSASGMTPKEARQACKTMTFAMTYGASVDGLHRLVRRKNKKGKGGIKSHPHHVRQKARRQMQARRRMMAWCARNFVWSATAAVLSTPMYRKYLTPRMQNIPIRAEAP